MSLTQDGHIVESSKAGTSESAWRHHKHCAGVTGAANTVRAKQDVWPPSQMACGRVGPPAWCPCHCTCKDFSTELSVPLDVVASFCSSYQFNSLKTAMRKTTRTGSSHVNHLHNDLQFTEHFHTHYVTNLDLLPSLHTSPPQARCLAGQRGPHGTPCCLPGPSRLLCLREACPDLDSPPYPLRGRRPAALPILPTREPVLKEGRGLIPWCPEGQLGVGTGRLLPE